MIDGDALYAKLDDDYGHHEVDLKLTINDLAFVSALLDRVLAGTDPRDRMVQYVTDMNSRLLDAAAEGTQEFIDAGGEV